MSGLQQTTQIQYGCDTVTRHTDPMRLTLTHKHFYNRFIRQSEIRFRTTPSNDIAAVWNGALRDIFSNAECSGWPPPVLLLTVRLCFCSG